MFSKNSDVWCFGDKSDSDWAVVYVFHISSFEDEYKLASWFLSLFHQFFTLMCIWLSFETEEPLFNTSPCFEFNEVRRALLTIVCPVV